VRVSSWVWRVERHAGIPTGYEVLRAGLRRLHQLENGRREPLSDPELDRWLKETGRKHITYSELLELIAPGQGVRREYLAGFFDGREPGPTHEALAASSTGRTGTRAGVRDNQLRSAPRARATLARSSQL
jgi:hypothetical protein